MDIVSDQVYLPSYRRRRSKRGTAAVVFAAWLVVYYLEKQTGILGFVYRGVAKCALLTCSSTTALQSLVVPI